MDQGKSHLIEGGAVRPELGDDDLSSRLSQFFTSWSNLANQPQDSGLRQVVVQNGESVATWMKGLRDQLSSLQTDVDTRLEGQTTDADNLSKQIGKLNVEIVAAEAAVGRFVTGNRDGFDEPPFGREDIDSRGRRVGRLEAVEVARSGERASEEVVGGVDAGERGHA